MSKKKPTKRKRPKQDPADAAGNYVDNKEFLRDMIEWKDMCRAAEESGDPRPPMTDAIGQKFILIADGVSRKGNFNGYTYKDEAVLDGIEHCVRYGHNFDPEKSSNPFSYFSQIIYYAFLRRIAIEKKESLKKKKCIEMAIDDPRYTHDLGDAGTSANALVEMQQKLAGEISAYERDNKSSKKKKKKSSVKTSSSSSSESLFPDEE